MCDGSLVLRIAGFDVKGLCFSVRKCELPLGIGEKYGSRGGMTVHDGFLVGTIVRLKNSHLIVFRDHRVMLGINFDRILRRDDARETETHQHCTTQPQLHSHVALLGVFGGETAQPYAWSIAMSTKPRPLRKIEGWPSIRAKALSRAHFF